MGRVQARRGWAVAGGGAHRPCQSQPVRSGHVGDQVLCATAAGRSRSQVTSACVCHQARHEGSAVQPGGSDGDRAAAARLLCVALVAPLCVPSSALALNPLAAGCGQVGGGCRSVPGVPRAALRRPRPAGQRLRRQGRDLPRWSLSALLGEPACMHPTCAYAPHYWAMPAMPDKVACSRKGCSLLLMWLRCAPTPTTSGTFRRR